MWRKKGQTNNNTTVCAIIGLTENNGFIFKKTQDFAQLVREQPPLEENEECVSYVVESLFRNFPIHGTIKYILEEIYTHNKLPHICRK